MSMRDFIALAVIGAHAAAVGWLVGATTPDSEQRAADPETTAYVLTLPERAVPASIPVPVVSLALPPPDLPTITDVKFEDPDAGPTPEVTADASAPRLTALQDVDGEVFARRAGLTSDVSITVVLSVEVLPDGSTGQVSVIAGSNNLRVDAQFAEYVRRLHWIPGSVHGRPTAMKIQFPVTLSVRS